MNSAQDQHTKPDLNAITERFYKSRTAIQSMVQAERESSQEKPRITVVHDLHNAKKMTVALAGNKKNAEAPKQKQPSFLRQLLTDVGNTFDDDDDSGSVLAAMEGEIARSARSKPVLTKDSSWTDVAAELVQDVSNTFDDDDDSITSATAEDDSVMVVHPPSAADVAPAPSMLDEPEPSPPQPPSKVKETTYVCSRGDVTERPSLWQNLMGLASEVGNTFDDDDM